MALWNKKPTNKIVKVAQTSLDDLRQELQDMDIQIITYNHHRNAIIEKIAYFENQLSTESTQEPTAKVVEGDKTTGNAETQAA